MNKSNKLENHNFVEDAIFKSLKGPIYLSHIDRNDNLLECLTECQQYIHDGTMEPLWNLENNWDVDLTFYKKQLQNDLEHNYNLTDAEQIVIENNEHVENCLYDLDQSNILSDLISNTPSVHMFYDTGYEMESESWRWDNKRVAKECCKIMKHLGVSQKEIKNHQLTQSSFWKTLWNCVQNATYGGTVEIYFRDRFNDYIVEDETINTIEFKNFSIGIICHGNGSGYLEDTVNTHIKLPFNKKNLFIEKTITYNWTFDIAGMCHDAYDSTKVILSHSTNKKIVKQSKLNAYLEKEAALNEVFKNGGCTFGDMRYTRHRQTEYINNYPCGNKCLKCGTFWID